MYQNTCVKQTLKSRVLSLLLDNQCSLDLIDKKYSTPDETRFIIVGMTDVYGLVYLVYTMSSENEICFITARKAEKFYVKQYEEIIRGN